MEPPKNYGSDEHDSEHTTSSSVVSSPSPSEEHTFVEPLFGRFKELPPELRHEIWRLAIPTPGINFFNVHCIPNDHPGANRSTSPSLLYLDLRRLSIDDDDATVAEYDPSAWLARANLRAVCREARDVCSLPDSDAETITLTRPKRGLFVRAGDGQLRSLVPAHPAGDGQDAPPMPGPEPLERRSVRVHRDDVLSLSVENCSFNLPFEETPVEVGGGNPRVISRSHYRSHLGHWGEFVDDDYGDEYDGLDDDDDDDDVDLGWSFDPELQPGIPLTIPESRRCLNTARHQKDFPIHVIDLVSIDDEKYARRGSSGRDFVLCMSDGTTEDQDAVCARIEKCRVRFSRELGTVFWDRFGDRYVQLPWSIYTNDLIKVSPEKNDIRERYLRSALLLSSKRPVGLF
ncbi:hypothetical protein Hte_001500 [Hypoxylon texense]